MPGCIGVFDSGLGGLSVVQEIQRLMPEENIFYIGDTAHVPYGPRPSEEVRGFSLAIARYLVEKAACRAIVIACNTAVSAAAPALRQAFSVPVIAIEPGVKPAVALTRTGKVGVLATQGTLTGDRFQSLVERFAGGVEVITQPCPGLVECVERGDLDGREARTLTERYVLPLVVRGVDTLVLGCTHYPFLRPLIEQIAGPDVQIVDTGEAVARQTRKVLFVLREAQNNFPSTPNTRPGIIQMCVTGEAAAAERGVHACFRAMGQDAPAIKRLFWRGKELDDYATS